MEEVEECNKHKKRIREVECEVKKGSKQESETERGKNSNERHIMRMRESK